MKGIMKNKLHSFHVMFLVITGVISLEVDVDVLGSVFGGLAGLVDKPTPQSQKDALILLKAMNTNNKIERNTNWSEELSLSQWSHIRVGSDGLIESLLLNDLDIVGDIRDLSNILTPTLRVLQLNGNGGLTGDLSLLTKSPNLEELWLFNHPAVSGDISFMRSLPRLINVGLYRTGVSGDMGKAFKDIQFPNLSMFVAAETKLTGDVNMAFSQKTTPQLTKLNLLKVMNLICDVDILVQQFPNLAALGLSDSFEITGDIESFQDTPYIQDLRLWSTTVRGNVKVFENLSMLTGLNLHHTHVYGDATFFETCCPQLHELHLWATDTTGDSEKMRAARGKTVYVDW